MSTLQSGFVDAVETQRALLRLQAQRIRAQEDIIGSYERTLRLLLTLAQCGADITQQLKDVVADFDAVKP